VNERLLYRRTSLRRPRRHTVATCGTTGHTGLCWHAACGECGWTTGSVLGGCRTHAAALFHLAAHLRVAHGAAL